MPLETDVSSTGFSAQALLDMLDKETESVNKALTDMQNNTDDINISSMFDMQMKMNRLAQTSEMATSVVGSSHQTLMTMARGIK